MQESIDKLTEKIELYNTKLSSIFALEKMNEKAFVLLQGTILVALYYYLNNMTYIVGKNIIHTVCWPFFPTCWKFQDALFLNNYTDLRGIYFAGIMVILTLSLTALVKRYYGISIFMAAIVFFISIFPIFIFTDNYNIVVHHQDHYLFYICLIFFLARHSRVQLLCLFFVLTYLFSSVPKFTSEFWILGFIQVPYFPDSIVPLLTNIVIVSQLVLPLLILFGNRWLRYGSVLFLEIFHFYSMSIGIVRYSFFWVTVPFVYLLFVEFFERPDFKIFRKNLLATLVFVLFTLMSLARLIIPGNDQVTSEGSGYALNMFNTNYTYNIITGDFGPNTYAKDLYPYYYVYQTLYKLQKNCVDDTPRKLKIRVGSIFRVYTIVEVDDYCKLKYNPYWHNEWIQDPPSDIKLYPYNLNWLQLQIFKIEDVLGLAYYTIFIFGMIFLVKKLKE